MYNFNSGEWTTADDYPYGNEVWISHYAMVYITEIQSYLVIGGYEKNGDSSQIAKFTNGVWSDVGQLNNARYVSFCSF